MALDEMLDPALVRLRQLIDDDSSGVAFATVREILDRHIGKSTQRIEVAIRQQAEDLAAKYGLNADELIAEAELIVAGPK